MHKEETLMLKYFHFISDSSFNFEIIGDLLRDNSLQNIELIMVNEKQGLFISEDQMSSYYLEKSMPQLTNDLGVNLTILIAHDNTEFIRECTTLCFDKFKNKVMNLSDFILEMIIEKNNDVLNDFVCSFASVNDVLKETILAYIKSNMNIVLASKKIYVHRNTFNYRLSQFFNLTNLDVRDFYNSLLFIYYLKACNIVHTAQANNC